MSVRLLEVGRVVKPHGLSGEVVVELVTNRLERLAPGSTFPVEPARGHTTHELIVKSSRPHQGRYLVFFEGVVDRNGAEALRNVVLRAEAITDKEALFVHDLIGKEVIDRDGASRGVVTALEANPASDLLVIDDRFYVPVRFVVANDDKITIDAPEGIFG